MGTALRERRDEEAVRLFLQIQGKTESPPELEMLAHLKKTYGLESAKQLMHAFACFGCFYCKQGRETCPQCEGRGMREENIVCEGCIGMGLSRCGFCNGTGWIALGCIPAGFQVEVLLLRTKIAMERCKEILNKKMIRPTAKNPTHCFQTYAQHLLELDGIMGVFEETLVNAKSLVKSDHHLGDYISKVVCQGVKVAADCEKRRQKMVQWIIQSNRFAVDAKNMNPEEQDLARARVEFYEDLAHREKFVDTSLEHPFLNQAFQKFIGKN